MLTPENLPGDLDTLAALLDHPDPAIRRHAELRLTGRTDLAPRLPALVAAADSPEALRRLERIAQHQFLRALRTNANVPNLVGAIGVAFQVARATKPDEPARSVVTIRQAKPGFPGREAFLPDDQVLAIDGEPLPPDVTQTQFRQIAQSLMSGQRHTFSIIRDGQEREVELVVAAAIDLERLYDPGSELRSIHRDAWAVRRAELFDNHPLAGAALKPVDVDPWPDQP
ncbi:MAG: PDZ domain-containing protein [Planctomycetota bacterium]